MPDHVILTPTPTFAGGYSASDYRTVTRGGSAGNLEVRYSVTAPNEAMLAGVYVKSGEASASRNWSERILDPSLNVVAPVVTPTAIAAGAEDGNTSSVKYDAGYAASLLVEAVSAGEDFTFGAYFRLLTEDTLVVTVVNV